MSKGASFKEREKWDLCIDDTYLSPALFYQMMKLSDWTDSDSIHAFNYVSLSVLLYIMTQNNHTLRTPIGNNDISAFMFFGNFKEMSYWFNFRWHRRKFSHFE